MSAETSIRPFRERGSTGHGEVDVLFRADVYTVATLVDQAVVISAQ